MRSSYSRPELVGPVKDQRVLVMRCEARLKKQKKQLEEYSNQLLPKKILNEMELGDAFLTDQAISTRAWNSLQGQEGTDSTSPRATSLLHPSPCPSLGGRKNGHKNLSPLRFVKERPLRNSRHLQDTGPSPQNQSMNIMSIRW